ncbi:hypothetical protein FEM48_Zijuj10G0107900 [Ziziphus jujuba var. spinosa]|uniref:Uncharacterized protein n=1 Tax=Ziziphus jujuba var. spinosa TaxID=714518 RepID=A0A978UMX6_ZIZJJ|nr:hypothetical protein FEM48_Zijuj10G0107900 [Ziziphus jujuba var. spinosa]
MAFLEETRPIPNTILQESAYPNIPNALSPEEAIMEDGGCKGLENEECLIRRERGQVSVEGTLLWRGG